MTRKCVLCKETNYRNTYSFFSAPKDPETRKKWQNAIAIENYAVTDDTYVCSKHFHKDDIITHWVSGVPPHVVTVSLISFVFIIYQYYSFTISMLFFLLYNSIILQIKYKKCRLRPGAVPERNYHSEDVQENYDDSQSTIDKFDKVNTIEEKKTDFLIPRTEEELQINNDENQFSCDFNDYIHNSKRNSLNKVELIENSPNVNNASYNGSKIKESLKQNKTTNLMENCIISETNLMESANFEDKRKNQSQISKGDSYFKIQKKSSESSSKNYISEEHEIIEWKHKTVKKNMSSKEKSPDNFKTENVYKMYIENQIVHNLNYNQLDEHYSMCNEIDENEMLFEDLLEICTEILLPRGWSCLVTSKGHTTTIVYLYMGMTKSGMPFTEKQVFIKSDMMLHCVVINKEIDPLIHNLIREGKHLKVQNLSDIEELIDEFDRRTVCQGIYIFFSFFFDLYL